MASRAVTAAETQPTVPGELPPRRGLATTLGLLALAIWSTSNALTRELTGRVGPFTLLAVGFGGGGLVLALLEAARRRSLLAPFRQPARYLVVCGLCLVGYLAGYAWGFALAPDDSVALVLGLVNYLWPSFILLFSLVFFPCRPRWTWLAPGLLLGPLGVVLAATPADGGLTGLGQAVSHTLLGSPLAFALMLGAAVCWGLYTNLARLLAGDRAGSGMPVLALGAGALFALAGQLTGERGDLRDLRDLPWPTLAWFCLGICGISYTMWDRAVRRGDLVLLGSASYLTPLAATAFAAWYLDQALSWGVLAGSGVIVLGAALTRRGIVERATATLAVSAAPPAGADRAAAGDGETPGRPR